MSWETITHRPDMNEPTRPVGLGDAVAVVAQPIAKAIDAVAGTNVQGCGGCKQRREALNHLIPNLRHPFSHGKNG